MTLRAGLGIDAGGTCTRWAVAIDGNVLAEGEVAGLSGLQLATETGRLAVHSTLTELAAQVRPHGPVGAICAGITGLGESAELQTSLGTLFSVPAAAITLASDIEIAYLASFAPGEGYLVYAGTGSIGAFIDPQGQFHRAGGRGVLLDDGGGGYWIAREALRHIWRAEDEQPGCWRSSPMAQAVFTRIGGDDWALSRHFMHAQERGAIGKLALAVAASADTDLVAAAILVRAGRELARLANALCQRFGPRPVVLAGRAASLHISIQVAMRAALPDAISLTQNAAPAHHAAARIAANATKI